MKGNKGKLNRHIIMSLMGNMSKPHMPKMDITRALRNGITKRNGWRNITKHNQTCYDQTQMQEPPSCKFHGIT